MEGHHKERQALLLELARQDQRDVQKTFHKINEAGSALLDAERVSIWQFLPGSSSLVCADLFERDVGHACGDILHADQFPRYFEAIRQRRAVAAEDAIQDPRTADLADVYLRPKGITAMLDVPIWQSGELAGVLCAERVGQPPRRWYCEDENFATSLADIAALSLEAAARHVAEQRLREVVSVVKEAVFVIDHSGHGSAMNPAAERFIARIGSDTLGGAGKVIELLDLAGRAIPLEGWPTQRALRGDVINAEVVALRFKDTSDELFIRVHAAPIFQGTQVRSAVVIVANVSHEVALEHLKRDLLSALAHEVKTPAAITKGYAQFMMRSKDVPATFTPMLAAIERAADRMDELVGVLLTTSSIMLGQLVLNREPFDLSEVVEALVAHKSSATGLLISLHCNGAAQVVGDRGRLEQAIAQLLENGVRFSAPGEPVEVAVTTPDHSVVVSVRDEGVRIPRSEYTTMFAPFVGAGRLSRRSDGGLGIGLFLAREIARAHGGDVRIESTATAGTIFQLQLPTSVTL